VREPDETGLECADEALTLGRRLVEFAEPDGGVAGTSHDEMPLAVAIASQTSSGDAEIS
jgi:hypothetical protein